MIRLLYTFILFLVVMILMSSTNALLVLQNNLSKDIYVEIPSNNDFKRFLVRPNEKLFFKGLGEGKLIVVINVEHHVVFPTPYGDQGYLYEYFINDQGVELSKYEDMSLVTSIIGYIKYLRYSRFSYSSGIYSSKYFKDVIDQKGWVASLAFLYNALEGSHEVGHIFQWVLKNEALM